MGCWDRYRSDNYRRDNYGRGDDYTGEVEVSCVQTMVDARIITASKAEGKLYQGVQAAGGAVLQRNNLVPNCQAILIEHQDNQALGSQREENT